MKQSLLHTVFKQTGKQALLVAFAMLMSMQAIKTATPQCNQVVCSDVVKTNKLAAQKVCAGDINVRGDLVVSGSLIIEGELVIDGTLDVDTINARNANIDTARIKVEGVDISYTTTEIVQDFHQFDSDQFLTPNYDRFPDGVLPETHKAGPGNIYSYTSLNPLVVNEVGQSWTDIVHGFVDFDSTGTTAPFGSPKDRLNYYAGAIRRIYHLMIDRPFSGNEEQIKIGYWGSGWVPTGYSQVMPQNQQNLAAQAMDILRAGLEEDVLPYIEFLSPSDRTVLFNHITLATFYAEAWRLGTTLTNYLGAEYFGSPNPYNLGNYFYSTAYYPPLPNPTYLIAFGINTDPGNLLPIARSLPIMFRLTPLVLQNMIDSSLEGLQQGFYPHVLRSRPYSSKGESTFGDPNPIFNYEPYIIDLVQSGQLFPWDDPRTDAQRDYDVLSTTDFEGQLNEDIIYGDNAVGALNPLPLLEFLVVEGYMTQLEADFIEEECRKYYPAVQAKYNEFLQVMYLDPASPIVSSLRMTRYDDYPGEWGSKFLVNEDALVYGTVKSGPNTGLIVLVDPLAQPDVTITDTNGAPVAVNLIDVDLQRDEEFGNAQYQAMAQIVLRVSPDTAIPTFVKTGTNPTPQNPYDNWTVELIDTPSLNLIEKLHDSGVNLLAFYEEAIDFYLDEWVQDEFGVPQWEDLFPTMTVAIKAITEAGRYIGDLEDPVVGGTYAFIQHYKAREDVDGPLYDIAQIEAFYDGEPWDGTPILNPASLTQVVDRDGNVIYDPLVIDPMTGYIDVTKLFELTEVDNDKNDYYQSLSQNENAQGLAARIYYFNYDFVKHSFADYMAGGSDPVLGQYFSPYIQSVFEKNMANKFVNQPFASGSQWNPQTEVITYTNYVNFADPHAESFPGVRATYLHEFIMGHALEQPLIQLRNAEGINSWISQAIGNSVTAEGWAVFIESFFGSFFTTYLSTTDDYGNYTDPCGKPDPRVLVPMFVGVSRVANRLKWDTELHYGKYKSSMAEYFRGFREDSFNSFTANDEVAQRIPTGPTQGLNYGLGFLLVLGLFEGLESSIGSEKFCELQNNGNLAFRYFFDTLLLDSQGYFLSSLEPIINELANEITEGIPPYNDPNYQGYPVDAFQFNTVDYVPGTDPAVYEFSANPYVPGGFTFVLPATPIPCDLPPCS